MTDKRYLILTIEDAAAIARHLECAPASATMMVIVNRLQADTGADIEEIVAKLKGLPICGACNIEGQAGGCYSLAAQKLGRRLNRLLQRARGERGPGPASPAAETLAAVPEGDDQVRGR